MALTTFGPIEYPPIDRRAGNGGDPGGQSSFLMNAAAHKVAVIFTAPKTGNLAKVRFRTGVVTAGDTLKVSFQGVSLVNGDPDGTVGQFRTVVIADIDDNVPVLTGLITSDGTDAGTKRAVTGGVDRIACVIEFNAFVAGNLNLVGRATVNPGNIGAGNVYIDQFTAAWAKQGAMPLLAIEYDDGSYAWIAGVDPAVGGVASESFLSTSTPDERGNLITPPVAVGCIGMWAWIDLDADADLVLYDTDGSTVLKTISLDKDVRSTTIAAPMLVSFPRITLNASGTYRIVVKPGAAAVSVYVADYVTSAVMAAALGGTGTDIQATTRTDAGAWTNTATKRYLAGLVLDGL